MKQETKQNHLQKVGKNTKEFKRIKTKNNNKTVKKAFTYINIFDCVHK